tara:strand:- start:154 stop:357 length:204 start_codon:yes stop_codon:yes gene_type:complete
MKEIVIEIEDDLHESIKSIANELNLSETELHKMIFMEGMKELKVGMKAAMEMLKKVLENIRWYDEWQ